MRHANHGGQTQRRHAAAMRRDGALARLSSVTGAIGVATIAAVGLLGVYVGKALPGHHAATSTGTTATSGAGNQVGNSGNTGSNQGAINPSSTPTQGTSLPPPVTSGAS